MKNDCLKIKYLLNESGCLLQCGCKLFLNKHGINAVVYEMTDCLYELVMLL